jgi:hypothetical protein
MLPFEVTIIERGLKVQISEYFDKTIDLATDWSIYEQIFSHLI